MKSESSGTSTEGCRLVSWEELSSCLGAALSQDWLRASLLNRTEIYLLILSIGLLIWTLKTKIRRKTATVLLALSTATAPITVRRVTQVVSSQCFRESHPIPPPPPAHLRLPQPPFAHFTAYIGITGQSVMLPSAKFLCSKSKVTDCLSTRSLSQVLATEVIPHL